MVVAGEALPQTLKCPRHRWEAHRQTGSSLALAPASAAS